MRLLTTASGPATRAAVHPIMPVVATTRGLPSALRLPPLSQLPARIASAAASSTTAAGSARSATGAGAPAGRRRDVLGSPQGIMPAAFPDFD
jgi:hypothetical protein